MHLAFGKKKLVVLAVIFVTFFSIYNIYSEDIFFFTRSAFAYSQFWERNKNKHNFSDSRKVVSHFLSGSIGAGIEMIVWDNGIKRGSRLYVKSSVDLVFSGIIAAGAYNDTNSNSINYSIYGLNINGGALFTGVDWDVFIGGTFPKTNLIWGFGCIFDFVFPTYSPQYDVSGFFEKFHFYATPAVLFGYDIPLSKGRYKLTPQIRVGFTCNPLIPDDLIRDMHTVGGKYVQAEKYSGLFVDFSLAFSFASIKWRQSL